MEVEGEAVEEYELESEERKSLDYDVGEDSDEFGEELRASLQCSQFSQQTESEARLQL